MPLILPVFVVAGKSGNFANLIEQYGTVEHVHFV